MFIPFFSAALLTLFSSPVVWADFSVQTPTLTQCRPVQLSWDKTQGPYDILIANQSNICGYAVADLGQTTNNFATWNVSLPAGWLVVVSVENSHLDEGWSQAVQVQPSGDVSCLPAQLAALPNAHSTPSASASTTPSSTKVSGGRASQAPNGLSGAPSTRQIPSCAVLLGTIGVIAYAFFAL